MRWFIFTLWAYTSTIIATPAIPILSNSSNPETLRYEDVSNIFLFRNSVWEERIPINIIVLDLDDGIHKLFIEQYLGIPHTSYMRNFRAKLINGRGNYPTIVSSYEELLKKINEKYGSIGYIDGLKLFNFEEAYPQIVIVEVK